MTPTADSAAFAPRLRDPRWFPVDLDVERDRFHMLQLDQALVESAPFLDNRLPVDMTQATLVPSEAIAAAAVQAPEPGWLWHTSFCGSTLLARMLQWQPHSMVLREPAILRRLSDARAAQRTWREFVAPSVRLLARPWHPGARVVIKPTHAALNVASELMAVNPDSRGILLTSTLEDFVISHLKKLPQTLQNVPVLAGRALGASAFAQRLDAAALNPPDVLCAAALQWAAQREIAADLLLQVPARLLPFHWETLQDDPVGGAQASADWLQLSIPHADLATHARSVAGEHAKAPTRSYDAQARRAEVRMLSAEYASEIARTLAWAARHLEPKMRDLALTLDVPSASGLHGDTH